MLTQHSSETGGFHGSSEGCQSPALPFLYIRDHSLRDLSWHQDPRHGHTLESDTGVGGMGMHASCTAMGRGAHSIGFFSPKEHSGTNRGQLCWLGSASVTSALAPGGEWQGLLVSSVMKAVGVLLLSFGL